MPKLKKDKESARSKPSIKGKKAQPETSEDWAQAGIDLEDSGDRWVQQPEKANRFYLKAAEAYQTALQLDASNKDAAFNAARLPLVIAQQCALLARPRLELLEAAAEAHTRFLARWPDHTDGRFNLATIHLLWVELVGEHEVLASKRNDEVVHGHLLQAMELLETCRASQTEQLEKLATPEDAVSESSTAATSAVETGEMDTEEEASEVTYITSDILLDTLLAILDAFSNMFESGVPTQHIQTAQSHIATVVIPQAQLLLSRCADRDQATTQFDEVQRSIRIAELTHAHEAKTITLQDWRTSLEQLIADQAPTIEALVAYSLACVDLAQTMQKGAATEAALQEVWSVYTAGAAALLTEAVQRASTQQTRRPELWLARADVELLRSSIGGKTSLKNQSVLRTNAKIYYKRAVAECLPKHLRIANEAALKLAIVSAELEENMPGAMPEGVTREEAEQVILDARADGLFPGRWRLLSASG